MWHAVLSSSPCLARWWGCPRRFPLLGRSCYLTRHNVPSSGGTDSLSSRTIVMNSIRDQTLFYADVGVDRAVEKRTNQEWLSYAFNSPEALLIPVLESKSLVHDRKLAFISRTTLSKHAFPPDEIDVQPIFLGLNTKTAAPVFAFDVKRLPSADLAHCLLENGMEWVDLRKYGPELDISEAGLLAYARGMVEWHSRNRFCGCCGGKMSSKHGGHCLKCVSNQCESTIHPRLDPAIIVLVSFGDYVLLGRQERWERGRYSLLAGFVEVGEDLESAVAREVKEECDVDIDRKSIRYVGSQPWPFPSSLMLGFTAEAYPLKNGCTNDNDSLLMAGHSLPQIVVDKNELEDAKWIHRDFLHNFLSNGKLPHGTIFCVARRHAIARVMMESWISSTKVASWIGNDFPTVDIDEGVFKYVLLLLKDGKGNQKFVVRGSCSLPFHADILEQAHKQVRHFGLQVEPQGGGRMEHNSEQRYIHVYGFSQAYGQADHALTSLILKQWLPFHQISVSWGGY